uniref:PiggyBac transposable element-derived protein domain-containing protein n=1 Tax=Ditylenchus dipsaci TaxID=166011 RepID=A0A915D6F7_9BILA
MIQAVTPSTASPTKKRRKMDFGPGKAQFVFREQETMLKFQAKPTKQVNLYSTVHHNKEVHTSGKPRMIKDYNSSKFGVDIFDEMLGSNSYRPPVKRWPLRIFMAFIVGGAAINAHVLHGREVPRREFTNKLAISSWKVRRKEDQTMATGQQRLHDKSLDQLKVKQIGVTFAIKLDGIKMQLCSACKKIACEEHSVNQQFAPTVTRRKKESQQNDHKKFTCTKDDIWILPRNEEELRQKAAKIAMGKKIKEEKKKVHGADAPSDILKVHNQMSIILL